MVAGGYDTYLFILDVRKKRSEQSLISWLARGNHGLMLRSEIDRLLSLLEALLHMIWDVRRLCSTWELCFPLAVPLQGVSSICQGHQQLPVVQLPHALLLGI